MQHRSQGDETLFQAVEDYIRRRIEKPPASLLDGILGGIKKTASCGKSAQGGYPPGKTLGRAIDLILALADKTFAETLLGLIEKRGGKPSEIYTRAGITKQHFSKIRNNRGYQPTKETALAFAVALRLSLDETRDLIGRAGFTLSRSSKRDLVVEYFLKEGIYDMDELNYNLSARGLGTLTNRREERKEQART